MELPTKKGYRYEWSCQPKKECGHIIAEALAATERTDAKKALLAAGKTPTSLQIHQKPPHRVNSQDYGQHYMFIAIRKNVELGLGLGLASVKRPVLTVVHVGEGYARSQSPQNNRQHRAVAPGARITDVHVVPTGFHRKTSSSNPASEAIVGPGIRWTVGGRAVYRLLVTCGWRTPAYDTKRHYL